MGEVKSPYIILETNPTKYILGVLSV